LPTIVTKFSQAALDVLQVLLGRHGENLCMTEPENPPSLPDLASDPSVCRKGKSRFVWFFLVVALLASAGYVIYSNYPRSGLLVPVTQASPKLVALEQRLDVLETQLDKAARSQTDDTPAPVIEEVKKPKASVESKEVQDQQTAQKVIATAFAFWDLREAAKEGRSFAPQLTALRTASVNSPATTELIARLEPYALEGAPTLSHLREALTAEEKAVPAPVVENATASFGARIMVALRPFVTVRPLHDVRFSDLEKALDSGNTLAALEAVKALPLDVQKSLAAWKTKLEARSAIDDAFLALSARSVTPPSQRSAP
jgi:hypothetical protein